MEAISREFRRRTRDDRIQIPAKIPAGFRGFAKGAAVLAPSFLGTSISPDPIKVIEKQCCSDPIAGLASFPPLMRQEEKHAFKR